MSPERTVVWLASYPKSGNTWVRAILTALERSDTFFSLDLMSGGGQPHHLSTALSDLALDPRWLTADEAEVLRSDLLPGSQDELLVRKTHDMLRWRPSQWESTRPAPDPFARETTRAAIHVVRDPRDVAPSFADHFGVDLDTAVRQMGEEGRGFADPAQMFTEQRWGSWSEHTRSWTDPDAGFPVYTVRYEDMRVDAVGTLLPVLRAVGYDVTEEALAAAVERTRIDRLREEEQAGGFRERGRDASGSFFRSGRVGGWREVLSDQQVAAIEAAHGEVMTFHGYELLGQAPAPQLPEHLGITLALGVCPTDLGEDSRRSTSTWVAEDRVLVRFEGIWALLVESGSHATIEWMQEGPVPDWLAYSWTVTLAMLQRGRLVLHASVVRSGDRCIAIGGHAGAGKSTTVMALRQRGYQLLADDVALVDVTDSGVLVWPFQRDVHLMPDAVTALGLDDAKLPPLTAFPSKQSFMPEEPPIAPMRVDALVLLHRADVADVTMREISGVERLGLVLEHAGRQKTASAVLGEQRYFELVSELCGALPQIVLISRPTGEWTLDEVAQACEQLLAPSS